MMQLTEEQCAELIALAENIISYSNEQPGLRELARIAMAALKAERRLTVSVVQKNERLKEFNFYGYDSLPAGEHEFYNAPPVAALRLPDAIPEQLRDQVIDICDGFEVGDTGAQQIWDACLAEVKRLNATTPAEVKDA